MRRSFNITQDDHLALHKIDLMDLSDKYGTPLFVFDEDRLVKNFSMFRQAFESNYPKVIVCYSVKTNNNLTICRILQEQGAYAEVASELDLYVADKAGFSGDHIIFDGLYKPEDALRKALEKRVLLINVESFTEMERLNRIAGEMGVEQAVGLRISSFSPRSSFTNINPKNLIETIWCHPECRFGFSLAKAFSAFKYASGFTNLHVIGIMTHPHHGALERLAPLVRKIHDKLGIEIEFFNVGGGFNPGTTRSVKYSDLILDVVRQNFGFRSLLDEKRREVENIELVAKHIADDMKRELNGLPKPILITEPGQFIAGPSGILLLRVDHTKIADGYKWIIVDGGTNLVPIANIFTRRDIVVVNKVSLPRKEMVNVAGPLLYPDDILALKMPISQVNEGDILAVFDCGAYTLSSSTQFLHPRPVALLVNSRKEVRVIRERETCKDILRNDKFIIS